MAAENQIEIHIIYHLKMLGNFVIFTSEFKNFIALQQIGEYILPGISLQI